MGSNAFIKCSIAWMHWFHLQCNSFISSFFALHKLQQEKILNMKSWSSSRSAHHHCSRKLCTYQSCPSFYFEMGSNAFIKCSPFSILHSSSFFINYQQITSLNSCMFNRLDIWEGKYIKLQLLSHSLSYLLIFIRHLHFNLPHFTEIFAANTISIF